MSVFFSYSKRRVNSFSFPGSSLDDEVISLPDPSTRLFTHDEIIHVYESRPVQGGGEEYRICVRDKHKDEVELWTQEAVKSRPDFQRLHT